MRQAPGPIPKRLPDIAQSARAIQREVVDRPDTRIADMTIGQLILELSDGTPAYLTGSNAWLRSVFGRSSEACRSGRHRCTQHARQDDCICLERLDFDVVLSSEGSAERFINGALSVLNGRIPLGHRYRLDVTRFGSARIIMHDGTPIIDAWHLQDGESISELLMGYPGEHQRAAYYVSHSPTPASLIRLARAGYRNHLLDELSEACSTTYPGRRRGRRMELFGSGGVDAMIRLEKRTGVYPGQSAHPVDKIDISV